MNEAIFAEGNLGTYELLRPISRGNQQVWLGRNRSTSGETELVSIKVARADGSASELALIAEARLTESLKTPQLLRVLALAEQRGTRYLVQEWVPGDSLHLLMDRASLRGGIPPSVAAAIVDQVLAGLASLHDLRDPVNERPVFHGGLSSQTVLLSDRGSVKLLDVGVAWTGVAPSDADTVPIRGRLAFVAPEQISGRDVDGRADLFASGTLLYWLTTKQHPFKHHGTAGVVDSIFANEPIPLPSTLVPGFPKALEQVIMRALERDPEQRWQTATAMREALAAAMALPTPRASHDLLREFVGVLAGGRPLESPPSLSPPRFSLEPSSIDSRRRSTVLRRDRHGSKRQSRPLVGLVGVALAVAAVGTATFAGTRYQSQQGITPLRLAAGLTLPRAAARVPLHTLPPPPATSAEPLDSARPNAAPSAPKQRQLARAAGQPSSKPARGAKPRDLLTPTWE